MIQLDLDSMLNSMSKEAILAQVSTQIDTAIAKKVEEDNRKARYKKAVANVSAQVYTLDDLSVLKAALIEPVSRMEKQTSSKTSAPARGKYHPISLGKSDSIEPKAISNKEMEDLLGVLGTRVPGFF